MLIYFCVPANWNHDHSKQPHLLRPATVQEFEGFPSDLQARLSGRSPSSADLGSESRRNDSCLRLKIMKSTGIVGSDCFDGLSEENGVRWFPGELSAIFFFVFWESKARRLTKHASNY